MLNPTAMARTSVAASPMAAGVTSSTQEESPLSLAVQVCSPHSLPRDCTYLLLLLLQCCFPAFLKVCLLKHQLGIFGRNQHSGISKLFCHFNVANLFLRAGSNALGTKHNQTRCVRMWIDRSHGSSKTEP